jgi:hypothetical protein
MNNTLQRTFTDPRSLRPSPGMSIFSRDCMLLGKVRSVQGIYFRVSAVSGRDFWLSTDQVLFGNHSHLELTVTSREIDLFKLSRRGSESWEPPALNPLEDELLSERERQSQRERMERELSLQTSGHRRPPGGSAA